MSGKCENNDYKYSQNRGHWHEGIEEQPKILVSLADSIADCCSCPIKSVIGSVPSGAFFAGNRYNKISDHKHGSSFLVVKVTSSIQEIFSCCSLICFDAGKVFVVRAKF